VLLEIGQQKHREHYSHRNNKLCALLLGTASVLFTVTDFICDQQQQRTAAMQNYVSKKYFNKTQSLHYIQNFDLHASMCGWEQNFKFTYKQNCSLKLWQVIASISPLTASNLKMETTGPFKMLLIIHQTTQCHIPEDCSLNSFLSSIRRLLPAASESTALLWTCAECYLVFIHS
jgi:hypothetical protein